MRGVNKAIIVGRLGNDPIVKQFGNGGSVTHISVATSEQWNDKQTGEKREATEWHRISLFNRLGEIAAQYLKKGSAVYIEGSLRTHKYTDQNGVERYSTEIRADNLQMLDSNNMGGNATNNQGGVNNQNTFNNNQGGYPQNGSYNNSNAYNQGYPQNGGSNAQPNNNFDGQGGYDNSQNNPNNTGYSNQPSPNPFMSGNTTNQPPAQTISNASVSTPKPGVVDDDVPFAKVPF